jgi:hypothetical protein
VGSSGEAKSFIFGSSDEEARSTFFTPCSFFIMVASESEENQFQHILNLKKCAIFQNSIRKNARFFKIQNVSPFPLLPLTAVTLKHTR